MAASKEKLEIAHSFCLGTITNEKWPWRIGILTMDGAFVAEVRASIRTSRVAVRPIEIQCEIRKFHEIP